MAAMRAPPASSLRRAQLGDRGRLRHRDHDRVGGVAVPAQPHSTKTVSVTLWPDAGVGQQLVEQVGRLDVGPEVVVGVDDRQRRVDAPSSLVQRQPLLVLGGCPGGHRRQGYVMNSRRLPSGSRV